MSILAEFSADELCARQHIGPLIITAELEIAAVILVQSEEIISLHDHVIKFKECKALFHSLLVALSRKHAIDGEVGADFAQEVNIIEIKQPVRIVHHDGLVVGKIDKTAHLDLETVDIVLDRLLSQNLSKVLPSGRVTDHACAASKEGNRLVACHLKSLHEAESHKMAYMKAVRCRVKADIESGLAGIDQFSHLFLIGHLGEQASCLQFFINLHRFFSSMCSLHAPRLIFGTIAR